MEFYDFRFSWEWNKNPNWLSVHHFSEWFWYTTNQYIFDSICIFPEVSRWTWSVESSFGQIGAFSVRGNPIAAWEHGVAWRTCHWLWEHHYPSWYIIHHVPSFSHQFPMIYPSCCFFHHADLVSAPSKRLQRRDRCDTRGSRGHRNADARVSWVLFKVFVCFSNRKSTISGIYSEYFLFFLGPLRQIQVSGPSFIPKWLEEKSNLNWLIGH